MNTPVDELHDRLLLKVPEAARLLSMNDSTVWRMVWTGEIPSVKVGRSRRIRRADLEVWVQGRHVADVSHVG